MERGVAGELISMAQHSTPDQQKQAGQGLIEYTLILILVSLAAVAILSLLGPSIRDVYAEIHDNLAGILHEQLTITQAVYNPNSHMVRLRATINGGVDGTIDLTATPGGAMNRGDDFYHLNITGASCPCTITISSSTGSATSVTVP